MDVKKSPKASLEDKKSLYIMMGLVMVFVITSYSIHYTKLYEFGLIGFPLVHSFSKKYFTEKFEQLHLDAAYELYELQRIGDLSELLQQNEFSGLNVTIRNNFV